jgi:hypothetical protein
MCGHVPFLPTPTGWCDILMLRGCTQFCTNTLIATITLRDLAIVIPSSHSPRASRGIHVVREIRSGRGCRTVSTAGESPLPAPCLGPPVGLLCPVISSLLPHKPPVLSTTNTALIQNHHH